MKVQDVVNKMKTEKLLDEREVYVYAVKKGLLGGAAGAVANGVILSVYDDTLYIHKAALDNTYKECLEKIAIPAIKVIKAKAGLFSGSFTFEYEGKKYNYQLPSRANKFANFFAGK